MEEKKIGSAYYTLVRLRNVSHLSLYEHVQIGNWKSPYVTPGGTPPPPPPTVARVTR